MKGIIFNELEEMVTDAYGEDAWEMLITQSNLQTPEGLFVGPNTYPFEDLVAIVTTASKVTGKSVEELLHAFGEYLFPKLAEKFPMFLKEDMDAKAFLKTVGEIIHVEVHKLFPEATLPKFTTEDPGPDQLIMIYDSERHLCDLAEGLLVGVGKHFGQEIQFTQTECTKRGDPHCRFEIHFGPKAE